MSEMPDAGPGSGRARPPAAIKIREQEVGHDLVPSPEQVEWLPGHFSLDEEVRVVATPEAAKAAALLRTQLSPATGLPLGTEGNSGDVRLDLEGGAGLGAEGYRLLIAPMMARISAASPAGLVNGVTTLRQLLPADIYRSAPLRDGRPWELPCANIEDRPRYRWRGALLDVARHFFPQAFLLRFVDLLSMHKLNVLHLHLTDDQGWRFPSERYPLLTEVGAWRKRSPLGHEGDPAWRGKYDDTPHGGFYSKADLQELVAYAAQRNVTVLPEIDVPGHTQAAIAAYQDLGNVPEPLEVRCDWGVGQHVLNLADSTLDFCRDVLAEVMDIFPSAYVHVGGDECPTDEWRVSPSAAKRIAEGAAQDIEGLQSWFTSQLSAFLESNGRHLVGWDEILEGGDLPAGALLMSWRDENGGVHAARKGHDAVMCPYVPCYFYNYQSSEPTEPLAANKTITLSDVYAYEPTPAELEGEGRARVLGAQFTLWSEYLETPRDVEYMAFPRGSVFSEVVWSQQHYGFDEMTQRLERHLERLSALDVDFRPLDGPRPWQQGGNGRRSRPK
jgi:hexosaminidase